MVSILIMRQNIKRINIKKHNINLIANIKCLIIIIIKNIRITT